MQTTPLALVLAAGFSSRFGSDKRLARLADGRTLLEAVVDAIGAAGLACVVAQNSARCIEVPDGVATLIIPATVAERGMGASLAAAVAQLPAERGLLVCLADMPFVLPSTYAAIAAALRPGRIVAPRLRGEHGERGNPMAFSPEYREVLLQLDGDRGARDLLLARREMIDFVEVDDPGIHQDVDWPEALKR